MSRNIILGFLVIALMVLGGFSFFQSQNLSGLQSTSTQVVEQFNSSGTENSANIFATGTSLAANHFATSTEAAEEFNAVAATATHAILINNANIQRANATATQDSENSIATSTEVAANQLATGTALAQNYLATSTEVAANNFASATSSAQDLATESAALAAANDAQATNQAENAALLSTIEAIGYGGEGVFGASISLPDGFEFYQTELYEIALPESFDASDLSTNPRDFFARLASLGYEEAVEYLGEQDENFLFFGIDTELINGLPRATISIMRDRPSIESNLEDYLAGTYLGLENNTALISSDIVAINGQAAGRGILDQQFSNGTVRQIQYIFAAEGEFYIITFTVALSEFSYLRGMIEETVASFRLN